MNQNEVEEKLLSNLKFTFKIEDHGIEWNRNAGHEWHRPEGSGHTLWVGDPAPQGGFGWMVIADDTQEIVDKGFADTRPEARKAAVFALARLVGLFDDDPDSAKAHDAVVAAAESGVGDPAAVSRTLRFAAVAILGCCAGAAVLAAWLVLR